MSSHSASCYTEGCRSAQRLNHISLKLSLRLKPQKSVFFVFEDFVDSSNGAIINTSKGAIREKKQFWCLKLDPQSTFTTCNSNN